MMYKIRPKEKTRIIAEWEQVFDHFDHHDRIDKGLSKLNLFIATWKQTYPFIKTCFAEDTVVYYSGYLRFESKFRRIIYTTNSIESLNKKIKKLPKTNNLSKN